MNKYNIKQRILAAWNGTASEVPLTTWCFGLMPPPSLRWKQGNTEIQYWYSLRMEHIHTLPQPWTLEDDFRRALAWQSLGVDDILDVSVPWNIHPEVSWTDSKIPPSGDEVYPVILREYQTPAGRLRHAVRHTGEASPGWVIQPEVVPLFEDYNIPRAVKHAVKTAEDVPCIPYLYTAPDAAAKAWFEERMARVSAFAEANRIPVQAWGAFGMDGVVWLTGAEGAVMMAMDEPEVFGKLVDMVAAADYGRVELAAASAGVDMIVQRGWYSSTDFWSPKHFDRYVFPYVKQFANLAHQHGKKYAYTITTGIERIGPKLADAGVDVLYFVDPVQDNLSLERVKTLLGDRMTLVGGTNTVSLTKGSPQQIADEVKRAIDILGPTGRFILHPVDALFPDTPWSGVEALIRAWKEM